MFDLVCRLKVNDNNPHKISTLRHIYHKTGQKLCKNAAFDLSFIVFL